VNANGDFNASAWQ